MFEEMLSEEKNNKTLLEIYTNKENSKFDVGYVTATGQGCFVIASIDPKGRFDGFELMRTDSICLIRKDTIYLKKVRWLMEQNEAEIELFPSTECPLATLLKTAKEHKWMVCIEILDSGCDDVVGFVQQIESDYCVVADIDEEGRENGMDTMLLDDITQIACRSEHERELTALMQAKKPQ